MEIRSYKSPSPFTYVFQSVSFRGVLVSSFFPQMSLRHLGSFAGVHWVVGGVTVPKTPWMSLRHLGSFTGVHLVVGDVPVPKTRWVLFRCVLGGGDVTT